MLHSLGLSHTPVGPPDVLGTVQRIGLLQLDTIRVVARAHHHILWTRNQNYREPMLGQAMTDRRELFEHFTHDASLLPMAMYPMWRRQFRRMEDKARKWGWHSGMSGARDRREILERIRQEGPLCTRDFQSQPRKKAVWSRPPHKLALDYLWYAGELATSHRTNFIKYYDLTERVVPSKQRAQAPGEQAQIDWLCEAALARLGYATPGDLQRFWDAVTNAEARAWVDRQTDLVPVAVESADGSWHRAVAPADIEDSLAALPKPTSRLRIVNPFDPLIRDRKRLKRLFGFDYTIEIFVPAAKRRWGYYVYPLLEGERMVGRTEVTGDRKRSLLTVKNFWTEAGVTWGPNREDKLEAELMRMARFVGADEIEWL
ncbi:MAG: crosslink repair DNA glycosylase YcaQ family protein [Pseudomonadota bacterium]